MSVNATEYLINIERLQSVLKVHKATLLLTGDRSSLLVSDQTYSGSENIAKELDKLMEKYWDEF